MGFRGDGLVVHCVNKKNSDIAEVFVPGTAFVDLCVSQSDELFSFCNQDSFLLAMHIQLGINTLQVRFHCFYIYK